MEFTHREIKDWREWEGIVLSAEDYTFLQSYQFGEMYNPNYKFVIGDYVAFCAHIVSARRGKILKLRHAPLYLPKYSELSERETQLSALKDKMGEVEYAVVQRMDGDSVIWEVGKTLAVMPPEERIANEFYRSGNRQKVLLKEIKETDKGKRLIVSRSAPEFLEALFELEVPELASESIEIKSIAREAGSRSKVAVHSNVGGIDPIGSFVGQKGTRINSVMDELKMRDREEKIDIILWDEEIDEFLANSISPADALDVEIVDEEERQAKIYVAEDQLSLAIGRDGQNVRLAAKLTGWKIDILGKEGVKSNEEEGSEGEASEEPAGDEPEVEAESVEATEDQPEAQDEAEETTEAVEESVETEGSEEAVEDEKTAESEE